MKKLFLIGLVFSIMFVAGCIIPPEPPINKGKLVLSITDKQVEGLEELYVTIYGIEVHQPSLGVNGEITEELYPEGGRWLKFSSKEETFELMALDSSQGYKQLIGITELPTGTYTQIRFNVKNVKAVIDGVKYDVEVPSDKLKIVRSFDIKPIAATEMIIDFSPESLIKSGDSYKLKPVLKLLTQKEFEELQGSSSEQQIKFDSIEKGIRSQITEKMHKVFNDSKSFQKFYYDVILGIEIPVCYENENCEAGSVPVNMPVIDFDKKTVIMVFLGEKDNGKYGMKINKVTEAKKQITVYATETYAISDENESTLPVTVQPYEIISIKKTKLPVKVSWKQVIPVGPCAKEGEHYSKVWTEEYKESCCPGLTEWSSGMDTSISVAGKCYATGAVAGSPVGTCINCGNGICEDIENPCNCKKDCKTENSTYSTVAEFCNKYWNDSMQEMCNSGFEPMNELCKLAEACPTMEIVAIDDTDFLDQECDAVISCPEDYECASFPGVGLSCYPTEGIQTPCDFVTCPSGKTCIIAEIYPVQVSCGLVVTE